ncbi:MAG: PIN domain-containing protein [Magnetococcales bacterium]|nr:PIN domain-containing protein [Magnetococcales bacterium]
MSRFLLDTSALLALRDDEPGAERVAGLLEAATSGTEICYGCFISLMEILYRVWKDEGEEAGRLAYRRCLELPIDWIHESSSLLENAARIKATHSLSLGDSWIAAAALQANAILIHKDPEFINLKEVAQEPLPWK